MYRDNFKYCTRCGGELAECEIDGKARLKCPSCGHIQYINPTPAAGVCLIENDRILLVQRAVEPKKGMWQIPAGFLEVDEDVEACAVREIKEETNLDIQIEGTTGVYSVFDDPRYVCLLILYRGRIVGGDLKAGDDAADARFFSPEELPPIAFESHEKVIARLFPAD